MCTLYQKWQAVSQSGKGKAYRLTGPSLDLKFLQFWPLMETFGTTYFGVLCCSGGTVAEGLTLFPLCKKTCICVCGYFGFPIEREIKMEVWLAYPQ